MKHRSLTYYGKYFLCLLLLCCVPIGVHSAENVKDLQKQQRKLQKQLEETKKMLKNTKSNEKATLNKLALLGKDISTRRELINNMTNEINALDTEIDNLHVQQEVLFARLDSVRAEYAQLVRQTHYTKMKLSPLLFILSAKSFNQLFRRLQYMQQFTQYQQMQIEQIKHFQTELALQDELLKQDKQTRKETLKKQERERDNLRRTEKKHKSMLAELQKKSKSLASQQKKQQKKIDALNAKIENIISQQVKQAAKQVLTKEQQAISERFENSKGNLPMPVENGIITGQYGIHHHPVYPDITINNRGIFIQATKNSDARAIFEGEVTSCFVVNSVYAIIIQHGSYRSVYTGISKPYVKTKEKVTAKQKIGKIYFDSEDDNKTELQFQIWKDRTIENPSLWLAKQ